MKKILLSFAILLFAFADLQSYGDKTISALKTEISRFLDSLESEQYPPYFIGYQVTDIQDAYVSTSFGRISSSGTGYRRILDIDLRVGDYNLDNTHPTSSGRSTIQTAFLPQTDDILALRNAIWLETEKAYRNAVISYQNVLSSRAIKVREEDTSADFSREVPAKYFEEQKVYSIDLKKWEGILTRASLFFDRYKWLLSASISFNFSNQYKIIVNSEGTEIAVNQPSFRVFIMVRTKADDGMVLYLYKTFFEFEEDKLPSEAAIREAAMKLVMTLDSLRKSPIMETYSGPAILSGEASGVFFHEIFGHRVEGHRQKDPRSSQTFKSYLNKQVLPEFIDVVFDPTIREYNGQTLSGYYKYDDEGVLAQKVVTVDNGIFKNFLMSRSPIENFPNSNGHGRKQPGYRAVTRQSNLLVLSRKQLPISELRKQLIEECKKQGKEYGLLFQKVEGGFTFTGRTIPNAFNVMPLVVYKIYVDGRPDEMVRGVDLIGTPLTTFAQIVATGDDFEVFNGTCGAESGGVPVSAGSPSILVSKIEVQKKEKSDEKPPILSCP